MSNLMKRSSSSHPSGKVSAPPVAATQDLRVKGMVRLLPPRALKAEQPMTEAAGETVTRGRETLRRILGQTDRRLLAVVGPCSIHDVAAALEYAGKLNALRRELRERLDLLGRN